MPGARGRLFSESKHGKLALTLARIYRDDWVAQAGLPVRPGAFIKRGPQANSQLGILGVFPGVKRERKRATRRYIRAACMIDGKEWHRDFYYGKNRTLEQAIELARRARAELVARKLERRQHGRARRGVR